MIKTLAKYIKGFWAVTILTPVTVIGEVLFEMLIPYLMGRLVDEGIYAGDMGAITRIGLAMIGVAILSLATGVMGGIFSARACTGFARNLRKAMHDNIQTFSFSNIDSFSTSSLVTRLTTDVTNIQNSFQMLLRMAMRAPFSLIIAMTMSIIISARLASIYLVAVVVLGAFLLTVMNRAAKYFRQVFERYDVLNESVRENISAIRVVKAYVREDHEIDKFTKAAANIYLMFCKAERNTAIIGPGMQIVVNVCILSISWIGAHMIVGGSLTTGQLMSLLTYCMNILMSLMMLSMIFVMLTMSQASARRIVEVIEAKSDLTDPEDPITTVADGRIEFKNVSFAYAGSSGEPVLKDIDLSISSGETIGILGSTGSAKSSLVNLISRLYDVSEGSLLVGGVDVRSYDLDTLRRNVAVVLQNNVLFSGSIADNLRWGKKDATLEEMKRACRLACADEFIDALPEGYDTMLEQGGTNLSGGQRQRLCIARALMMTPKILILDDSTSAVDTATDARIRKAFREEIPSVTKLIIAQRVMSLKDCDRIIVMDEGRVSGFDTPDALYKNNEIYREVYDSQTGAAGDADFDEKV